MSIVRRIVTVTAVAAAAVAAVPAAAQAVLPARTFAFSVVPGSLAIAKAGHGSGSLRLAAATGATGAPASLNHVVIVFNPGALAVTAFVPAGGDDATPAPGCTTKKAVTSCPVEAAAAHNGAYQLPGFVVAAKKGAKVGDQGTLAVTVQSKEAAPIKAKVTVSVVRDVDLGAVSKFPSSAVAEPVGFGAVVRQPIAIHNAGSFAARGTGMIIEYDKRFVPAAQYSNCAYDTSVIFCTFTEKIPAGATYQLQAPMFKLRADATANVAFPYGWEVYTSGAVKALGERWYHGHKTTPGAGGVLHLVPSPNTDPTPANAELKADAADAADAAGTKNEDVDLNGVNDLAQGWVKTPVESSRPASGPASPTAVGGNAGTAGGNAGTAGGNAGTTGGNPAASGGGLAVTGSNAALVAGAGVLLLAIGVGVFFFTRRRRTSFTA
ncbi:hypothetical protein [Actinoplanes sp. NPDC051411]|uniref:hypothetical protein n=1 Tax=Actinoplanes sp. NPDC051411 TaxID=3155522 RepID=UPI00341DCE7E